MLYLKDRPARMDATCHQSHWDSADSIFVTRRTRSRRTTVTRSSDSADKADQADSPRTAKAVAARNKSETGNEVVHKSIRGSLRKIPSPSWFDQPNPLNPRNRMRKIRPILVVDCHVPVRDATCHRSV